MSGLARYASVLRLFSEADAAWTIPAMSGALGTPASTLYRTVRDLVAEGFLEPSPDAAYRLGAAFVEFDRLTRLTDPLLRRGQPILREVVEQARLPCVGLLSRLYDETVMCVADEAAGGVSFRSSYERGRPMPLTRGATSQAILAQLPARRLNRLLARGMTADAPPSFGQGLEQFRAVLAGIRRRGFIVTRGEIDRGLVGLAAPVAEPALGLVASLSLVLDAKGLDDAAERRLTLLLVSSASLLTDELRKVSVAGRAGAARPAIAAKPRG